MRYIFVFCCFWGLLSAPSFSQKPEYKALGKFKLKNSEGNKFRFSELSNKLATVVIFMGADCPICQQYTSSLNDLFRQIKSDSIEFYAVLSGKLATLENANKLSSKYHFEIPILLDQRQKFSHSLEAIITPEVFVLNQRGAIEYSGAIDNWFFELGKKRNTVSESYLMDALEALINHRTPEIPRTKAIGCFITYH